MTMAGRDASVASWLDIAADEKAESVIRLAPANVRSVVDVGCGAGSVLEALDRRGFGETYWACEPSSLAQEIPDLARLQGVANCTFDDAFKGRSFDLAILSHVVEHVRAPATLISQVIDRSKHVIIEVPIEASRLTRIRKRGVDLTKDHPSGHVHFFSEYDARRLVGVAGGVIGAERAYFPLAPYRHLARRPAQRMMLTLASHFERAARLHYEHFAMRASARTFPDWRHHYPHP